MSFSSQKGEFDRFFNRLDRLVEESRPDRQPDRPVDPTGAGRPDRPVDPTGAGRPDRFPSLIHTMQEIATILVCSFNLGLLQVWGPIIIIFLCSRNKFANNQQKQTPSVTNQCQLTVAN